MNKVIEVLEDAASDNNCQCGYVGCSKQERRRNLQSVQGKFTELMEAGTAFIAVLDKSLVVEPDSEYDDLSYIMEYGEAEKRFRKALENCNA